MAQHEVAKPVALLDGQGRLVEEGWARKPYWRYDRSKVAAPAWRLKEWDYYSVISHDRKYGAAFTMSDLGYLGLFSVAWMDLASGKVAQAQDMSMLPFGRTGFSEDSDKESLSRESAKCSISFEKKGGERRLRADFPEFAAPDGARGSVSIHADAALYAGLFNGSESAELALDPKRKAYVHLVRGALDVNGQRLQAGDAAVIAGAERLTLARGDDAEVLVFDLVA